MLGWLKSLFSSGVPEPAGPAQVVRAISIDEAPLTRDSVTREGDAWQVRAEAPGHIRLYDVELPRLEQCLLTYRLRMRSRDVAKGAYLEMWCRVVGRGEFFSKGVMQKVRGTTDWSEYEVPFYLRKGQQADLLKLGLTFDGPGTVWVKDVQVLQTPVRS
jgi:hypothetical protein